MRIALINADRDVWALGMRTVAGALKQARHCTRLIFTSSTGHVLGDAELGQIRELVKECDLVGVSSLSHGSQRAGQILRAVRAMKKLTIWGGVHATLNPKECAQSADLACVGEGEGMMVELADRLQTGRDWHDMENVACRSNGDVVVNRIRPLIENLDSLPLPDFGCEDEFHHRSGAYERVARVEDRMSPGVIIFNGSRGCAFHCTYCCNARLKQILSDGGRYVRRQSVARFMENTRTLKAQFPHARYFFFIDEDFFARPLEELRQMAEEYPKLVGLPFECCGSPPQIREEKMELLVRAGLWRVRMGIESGSERTKREVFRRPISNEMVKRAAEVIGRRPEITSYYFLIIGNPYEQPQDLVETARFLSSLPRGYFLQAFNLVFFPGSLLYDMAVRDGLITGREDSGYELDFRGGLRTGEHEWKQRNLYLNTVLFLMEGRSTHRRLGVVPRRLVPWLLKPGVIDFNGRHLSLTRFAITLRIGSLWVRGRVARVLKSLLGDPTAVYNLKHFFKQRLRLRKPAASTAGGRPDEGDTSTPCE